MRQLVVEVAVDQSALGVSIDGDPVPIEASDDGVVRGTSVHAVAAGRHVVRLECVAGEATIRWLELTCAPG